MFEIDKTYTLKTEFPKLSGSEVRTDEGVWENLHNFRSQVWRLGLGTTFVQGKFHAFVVVMDETPGNIQAKISGFFTKLGNRP